MKSKFDPVSYVNSIESIFRKNGNPVRAAGAKAYMRNQFEYYGLDTTTRGGIQQIFHSKHALPPKEALEAIIELC